MKKKILIADDDKEKALERANLLEEKGFDVDVVFDGKQALKFLRKKEYDLVVLDLDMPRLSGDEVLEKIKEDPKLSSLKVLVVTGVEEHDELVKKAERLGMLKRGWQNFKILRKWEESVSASIEYLFSSKGGKYPIYPDLLSEREFLEAVEEMFLEVIPFDRPRKEDGPWYILVVDDEKEIRETIKERLKRRKNFKIIEASEGEEALEILSSQPVDLIILDLEMPRLSGDELLEIINFTPILREIPVIIYTKHYEWQTKEEKEEEKDFILRKSFYKKKESRFLRWLRMDNLSLLEEEIDKFLEERQRLGLGYLKEKITFIKNKKGKYIPALEYFSPVKEENYRIGSFYLCGYCQEKKIVGKDFKAMKYNLSMWEKIPLKPVYFREVIICPECVKEIRAVYPQLGKFYFQYKKEEEERERKKKEIIEALKDFRKKVTPRKEIIEKIEDIVKEAYSPDPLHRPYEIPLDAPLRKLIPPSDSYKDFLLLLSGTIENEWGIEISPEELGWADTPQDLAYLIEYELQKRERNNI